MTSAPQWQIGQSGDFNSDLHRLNSLLDIICEVQFGLSQGEIDPRVDDLLWIAREMSAGLSAHHDGTYVNNGSPGGLRTEETGEARR